MRAHDAEIEYGVLYRPGAALPDAPRPWVAACVAVPGNRVLAAVHDLGVVLVLDAASGEGIARWEGFAGVLPRFQHFFRMTGRTIRVRDLDGSTRAGRVTGIDADGALLLDGGDERGPERVVAGDVTLEKERA